MLTPLRTWCNKRIREMCRVTLHQEDLYGITSVELQKRIGIWDLDYYVGRRTLQWVGHVASIYKSRLPRRLLTAWVRESRSEFGQEMSYGRSLERWLKLFRPTTPINRVGHTSSGLGRVGAPRHP